MEFKGGSWKVMENYVRGTKNTKATYVVGIIRQDKEKLKEVKKA